MEAEPINKAIQAQRAGEPTIRVKKGAKSIGKRLHDCFIVDLVAIGCRRHILSINNEFGPLCSLFVQALSDRAVGRAWLAPSLKLASRQQGLNWPIIRGSFQFHNEGAIDCNSQQSLSLNQSVELLMSVVFIESCLARAYVYEPICPFQEA